MPRIGHYALPVSELEGLAHASSLEWVQSNPSRVAEVQAAIAAEPKPVHVPRERPPLVVLDEGPLILVETRRDLQQLAMPFESTHTAWDWTLLQSPILNRGGAQSSMRHQRCAPPGLCCGRFITPLPGQLSQCTPGLALQTWLSELRRTTLEHLLRLAPQRVPHAHPAIEVQQTHVLRLA
jgi:hypothetical protein